MKMSVFVLAMIVLAGCNQHLLSDQELYEQSKKCTDAGMYPVIASRTYVRCVIPATPKN